MIFQYRLHGKFSHLRQTYTRRHFVITRNHLQHHSPSASAYLRHAVPFVYREVPSRFSGKTKTGFMYILCAQNQFVISPIFFYLLRLTTLTSLISLFRSISTVFPHTLPYFSALIFSTEVQSGRWNLMVFVLRDVGTALRIRCFRNCTAGTARGRVSFHPKKYLRHFRSAAIPLPALPLRFRRLHLPPASYPRSHSRSQRPAGHYRHKHRTGHRLHRPPPTPLPSERRGSEIVSSRSASPGRAHGSRFLLHSRLSGFRNGSIPWTFRYLVPVIRFFSFCILRRQLVSDQVAAVIHIFSIGESYFLLCHSPSPGLPD